MTDRDVGQQLTSSQGCLQKTMNNDIGVATDGRCEMCVERGIEGVVVVSCRRENAAADVLGAVHGLDDQEADDLADIRVLNGVHRRLESAGARGIELDSNLFHVLNKVGHALLEGLLVATEEGLLGEKVKDLLGDTHIGEQHELFNQTVALLELKHSRIQRVLHVVSLECQLDRVDRERAIVETSLAENL